MLLLCGKELIYAGYLLLYLACGEGGHMSVKIDGSELRCLTPEEARQAELIEYPPCKDDSKHLPDPENARVDSFLMVRARHLNDMPPEILGTSFGHFTDKLKTLRTACKRTDRTTPL